MVPRNGSYRMRRDQTDTFLRTCSTRYLGPCRAVILEYRHATRACSLHSKRYAVCDGTRGQVDDHVLLLVAVGNGTTLVMV